MISNISDIFITVPTPGEYLIPFFFALIPVLSGARGGVAVKALRY